MNITRPLTCEFLGNLGWWDPAQCLELDDPKTIPLLLEQFGGDLPNSSPRNGCVFPARERTCRAVRADYEAHYHEERNHQGKDNILLFLLPTQAVRGEQEKVRCRERLGGLLKYYERKAA